MRWRSDDPHRVSQSADVLCPQCDGTDLTTKVQDLKLQCLLFLNIPRYGQQRETNFTLAGLFHVCPDDLSKCVCVCVYRYCAGTVPWGHPSEHYDFEPQRLDDGFIEVIGFTMTSLVSCTFHYKTSRGRPVYLIK